MHYSATYNSTEILPALCSCFPTGTSWLDKTLFSYFDLVCLKSQISIRIHFELVEHQLLHLPVSPMQPFGCWVAGLVTLTSVIYDILMRQSTNCVSVWLTWFISTGFGTMIWTLHVCNITISRGILPYSVGEFGGVFTALPRSFNCFLLIHRSISHGLLLDHGYTVLVLCVMVDQAL